MAQKPLQKGKKQQKQQAANRHGKKALTKKGAPSCLPAGIRALCAVCGA